MGTSNASRAFFLSKARRGVLLTLLMMWAWLNACFWLDRAQAATGIDPMEIPKLTEYVTDYSSVLNQNELSELRAIAREYETKTSNQMVVVLFPHRQGNELFDIAMKIFSRTSIGQKGADNGILLVIATEEKKIRIVTGYGLEGDIPDILASDFIEKTIRPSVNAGNYAQAVRGFFDRTMSAIGSDEAERLKAENESDARIVFSVLALPFGILFSLNIVSLGIALFLFWVVSVSLGSFLPILLFVVWMAITVGTGFAYFNPRFATMFWSIPESSWSGSSGSSSWGSGSRSGGGGFSWGGGSSGWGGAGD